MDEDQRLKESIMPPFSTELSPAQVNCPPEPRPVITEGPVAVSYPAVIPEPLNQGPKPGQDQING